MKSAAKSSAELDVEAIRADFPILHQSVYRGRPLIYLDNAASTQRPRQVIEGMSDVYRTTYANVHRGNHWLSEQCSLGFDSARAAVAKFINAQDAREIVWTSGTTSGINLVARAWGETHVRAGDEILLSEMEHHSNLVPWQQLASRTGAVLRYIPIDAAGQLDLSMFHQRLTPRTKVLAITAVSNVLGTVNPVAELVRAAQKYDALTVIDAAQHVPHEPTDVQFWGADFVAFSGHKMLGPSGVGVLYGRLERLEAMPPFLGGGGMIDQVRWDGFTPGEVPMRFEAGTPPIVEAIGLQIAIDYLGEVGLSRIQAHEKKLAAHTVQRIQSELPEVRILGPSTPSTGIVSFLAAGVHPLDLAKYLDFQGIAIRFGHHCAMPLHQRLGIPASCRASFYLYNTLDEADQLVEALRHGIQKLRA